MRRQLLNILAHLEFRKPFEEKKFGLIETRFHVVKKKKKKK